MLALFSNSDQWTSYTNWHAACLSNLGKHCNKILLFVVTLCHVLRCLSPNVCISQFIKQQKATYKSQHTICIKSCTRKGNLQFT